MKEDLRILALETAAELEKLARSFPAGEIGRRWLRMTAVRLRNAYARTRGQQKMMILKALGDGSRTIADLIDRLGFSRREVCSMLADLAEAGYLAERSVGHEGPGRPVAWHELTEKGAAVISLPK